MGGYRGVSRGQVDGREAARENGKLEGEGPSPPRPSAVVPAGPDPSPAVLPPVWGVSEEGESG